MNLFDPRPVGCTCAPLEDRIAYELEGVPAHLCGVHDGSAIAEREAARLRAVADVEQARFREVRASLEPPPPPCSCPDLTTSLRASLEGLTLAACAAHPSETSPMGSQMALNDNDGIVSILRGALGRDATFNNNPDGDLPPAA